MMNLCRDLGYTCAEFSYNCLISQTFHAFTYLFVDPSLELLGTNIRIRQLAAGAFAAKTAYRILRKFLSETESDTMRFFGEGVRKFDPNDPRPKLLLLQPKTVRTMTYDNPGLLSIMNKLKKTYDIKLVMIDSEKSYVQAHLNGEAEAERKLYASMFLSHGTDRGGGGVLFNDGASSKVVGFKSNMNLDEKAFDSLETDGRIIITACSVGKEKENCPLSRIAKVSKRLVIGPSDVVSPRSGCIQLSNAYPLEMRYWNSFSTELATREFHPDGSVRDLNLPLYQKVFFYIKDCSQIFWSIPEFLQTDVLVDETLHLLVGRLKNELELVSEQINDVFLQLQYRY